ncbi:MAG: hypothetical protein Edafosvirus54_4 [Edafosvirus sp.]|uniref:Uncharacterized protein n=1 Tax=Edafosvirus sp. TaxID=2487765 RepID=A0A3G5A033_9VIRU|nr:MAG: hypothetical protein Edafosvirus54_4 [Edafosvirus sp.]
MQFLLIELKNRMIDANGVEKMVLIEVDAMIVVQLCGQVIISLLLLQQKVPWNNLLID